MPKHVGLAIYRVYDLTADALPACGEFRPRVEAEPMPAFEAKVEPTPETTAGPNPAQRHGSTPRRGKGR